MMLALAPQPAEVWPMTERLTRRQTCSAHRPFTSYEAALQHYVAKVSIGEADPGQEVYRCSDHWHHGGAPFKSLGRLLAEAGWGDGHVVD